MNAIPRSSQEVKEAIRRLREAADPNQQREAIEDLVEINSTEVRNAFVEALGQTRPGCGFR